MHFVHLNVRSILSKGKFDNLKTQILRSEAQVISVSETWLNSKFYSKLLEILGYSFIRLDRNCSDNGKNVKKRGGLGIYIKNCKDYNETTFL